MFFVSGPAGSAGGGLKCLEDPSFAFEQPKSSKPPTAETVAAKSAAAAAAAAAADCATAGQPSKKPSYRVLEDPEPETRPPGYKVLEDPMMASVYQPAGQQSGFKGTQN